MSEIHDMRGIVFDIQRYSLHDGPGLRTNVFLKGCSLDCAWCSNPEAKNPAPQTAFFAERCFLCGDCLEVCPNNAIEIQKGRLAWDAAKCEASGKCVQVCPSQAFRTIGKEMSAAEVIAAAVRDAAFYAGRGGLTLTGGEPTFQPAFTQAILKLARAEGLHTAIETCGACTWTTLEELLPDLDLVLFDLKHMDADVHRKFTGGDNVSSLDNLRRTAKWGIEVAVRVPLVPGFNTSPDNLDATAAYIDSLAGKPAVHLLPYHTLGKAKYRALGMDYAMKDAPPMDMKTAEEMTAPFRARGLEVIVGG